MIAPESRKPPFWWFVLLEFYGNSLIKKDWIVVVKHTFPALAGMWATGYILLNVQISYWSFLLLQFGAMVFIQLLGSFAYSQWRRQKKNRYLYICDVLWGSMFRLFWVPILIAFLKTLLLM